MIDFMIQRAHILMVKYEEEKRAEPNEAIIAACDAALNAISRRDTVKTHIELSQGETNV